MLAELEAKSGNKKEKKGLRKFFSSLVGRRNDDIAGPDTRLIVMVFPWLGDAANRAAKDPTGELSRLAETFRIDKDIQVIKPWRGHHSFTGLAYSERPDASPMFHGFRFILNKARTGAFVLMASGYDTLEGASTARDALSRAFQEKE